MPKLILISLALILPTLTHAATTTASIFGCPTTPFTQNFGYRSEDSTTNGEVSRLQKFLGLRQTGGFGTVTAYNLFLFQVANGILPVTARYTPPRVAFGPMTRTKITSICGTSAPVLEPATSTSPRLYMPRSCPLSPDPVCPSGTKLVPGGKNADGCQMPGSCLSVSQCPNQLVVPICPAGQTLGTDANGCANTCLPRPVNPPSANLPKSTSTPNSSPSSTRVPSYSIPSFTYPPEATVQGPSIGM